MKKMLKTVTILTGALVSGGVIGWAFNLIHIEPALSCSIIIVLAIALQEAIKEKSMKRS